MQRSRSVRSTASLLAYCVVQDIISEHPERFFVGEIVRENFFMQYRKEVPYACQVSCICRFYIYNIINRSLNYKKEKSGLVFLVLIQ
jgi:hypothetical protein